MIIVVMGVSGAGKTTVGRRLAEALGARFCDADDLHPAANVEKMRRGVPLEDEDRAPWLAALVAAIEEWLREGAEVVLACSALRASYRAALLRDPARMRLVYLRVPAGSARERTARRAGHFMPARLVDSQFETLEEPAEAITVDATQALETVVHEILTALGR